MRHFLPATPQTVRFGIFDARIAPVLTVDPGDEVEIECVSGGPEVMPPARTSLLVPAALRAIHAANLERLGPHILTGPVAVRGAEPGDLLEVEIIEVTPNMDWGYCAVRPLGGTLPDDFGDFTVSHIPVDRLALQCKPSWGPTLPLAPFFGTMGVAPRASHGRLSSREPRDHGGNIDNKELTAGARLFLPVWVSGANFSVGDGHGRQGDGEVCVNALEMGLTGVFRFFLHKSGALDQPYPRAETASHFIAMGFHESLDGAMRRALREMIRFIVARCTLTPLEAYQFCSLAVDFRITQTVNGEKGVHAMLQKGILF